MALNIGARAGELCRLSPDDINIDAPVMTIRSTRSSQTKPGKIKTVFLPASSIEFFEPAEGTSNPAFLLKNDSETHWNVNWISKGFKMLDPKSWN